MSATVLREAAALMRKRAEAATPGPWEAIVCDSGISYRALTSDVVTAAMGDHVANADHDGDAEGPHGAEGADATHIASWHPAVALAVADWLDFVAAGREALDMVAKHKGEPLPAPSSDLFRDTEARALAVATAYLGRQP